MISDACHRGRQCNRFQPPHRKSVFPDMRNAFIQRYGHLLRLCVGPRFKLRRIVRLFRRTVRAQCNKVRHDAGCTERKVNRLDCLALRERVISAVIDIAGQRDAFQGRAAIKRTAVEHPNAVRDDDRFKACTIAECVCADIGHAGTHRKRSECGAAVECGIADGKDAVPVRNLGNSRTVFVRFIRNDSRPVRNGYHLRCSPLITEQNVVFADSRAVRLRIPPSGVQNCRLCNV